MRTAIRRALLALALAGCLPTAIAAQSGRRLLADYTIASWTDRDNLPSARIWAIEQDDAGYLWVGNDAGVFRFDGVRFTPIEKLVHSLPADRVVALLTPRDGGLWLGFDNGNIGRINSGQLSLYTERDGAPGDGIFTLMEDHAGAIWASNPQGLYRLRDKRWERLDETQGLPQGPILTVFEDHRRQLWAATRTTVLRQTSIDGRFEPVGLVESAGFLSPRFSEDAAGGGIWMTDRLQGFRRIDAPEPVANPDVRGSGIYLLHDRKGNLWVATQGRGLWRARPDPSRHSLVVDTITAQDGLLSDAVRAIHEDREGNIWVGTYSGLQRFSPRRVASLTEFGIARTLSLTPDGSVWIAAASGLVRRMESGVRTYSERDGLPGPTVLALHTDARGVLWIGTDRGVARFVDNRFVPVRITSSGELSRPLTITGGQTIWVRDADRGWFQAVNEALTPSAAFGSLERGISSARTDRRERVWLGPTPAGVMVMEPNGDRSRSIDLPIGRVSAMYESRSGNMWIGGSSGLSLVSDTRTASIGLQNGLPPSVFSLVEDADGTLWLAVSTGIIRLTRDEFDKASADPTYRVRYRLFDASDGSAGVPTRTGGSVAVRDKTGKLWFVTSNGLTVIDPNSIGEAPGVPPARIESAVADTRAVEPVNDMRLPARTSHLQIDFTSLMLTDPTRARFRYRLDGFDNNWLDAGTARQATYTNLPPGQYRFRVVASNNEDTWSDHGATWAFSIRPTFYQTRTFYVGCLIAAGLIAWMVWHLRVRQVRKEFALVLAERIRMSRAIHDTLLQGLVGLALEFNHLSRAVESSPAARDQLSLIRRRIEEYIREARSSIWDLRSPRLQSRDLPTALREVAEQATAGTPAQLEFSVVGTRRPASGRVEDQLLVIGQEAVSNAVRHGQARHVRVELRYDRDTLGLRVIDDGRGFDVEVARRTSGHYGLISMSERAEEVHGSVSIVSGPGSGTEIDAVVPLAS